MDKEVCPLQETCEDYNNGSKRKGHHIRKTTPCIKDCTGKACEVSKIRRIKGGLKK